MDYKNKLDIMQKKEKLKVVLGSISGLTFGLFLLTMLGFYPISIANSDKSYSNLITYFALKADFKLFLWIAVISLVLSIMSFIAIILGHKLIDRRHNSPNG